MSGIFSSIGFVKEVKTASLPTITSISSVTPGAPGVATVTSSAHGAVQGDVVTISGASPSGYNGTFVVASATTNTFTYQVGSVTLTTPATGTPIFTAMTKYGNPSNAIVVSKHREFVSENIKAVQGRVESKALRQNNRVVGKDRIVPYAQNVGGDVTVELASTGLSYFLEALTGKVATAGPADTSVYTHTATLGAPTTTAQSDGLTRGKSYTIQKRLPNSSGGEAILTYNGMKLSAWALSCAIDSVATLSMTFIGQDEETTIAYATPTYPSGELLTFAGGTATVGGVAVGNIKSVNIKGNLGLKGDRRFLGATTQKEPIENAMATFDADMTVEFNDLTFYNYYKGTTPAAVCAAFVFSFVAPTLIGASVATTAGLTVSIPNGRIDGETPGIASADLLEQSIKVTALNSAAGTNDAISLTYVTTDTSTS